jgi:hypothetical protein
MQHVWGTGEGNTGFWFRRKLKERSHVQDLRVGRRIVLKWIFKKQIGGLDLLQDDECRPHFKTAMCFHV